MPTSYTPVLKLALPATAELTGTWGDVVNQNITEMVEQAVVGRASISSWTSNVHTLSVVDGLSSTSRCLMLDLSGTLTNTGSLVIPAGFTKMYIVRNGTAGGFAVTVGMPTGATVSVPNGRSMIVYADSTNTREVVTNINSLTVGGFTLTLAGSLTTAGANALTLTTTGATNVTLPTTGTLSTLAGSETLTNKTLTTPVLSGTASGTTAGRLGYLSGALSYGTGSVQRTVVNTDEAQTLTNKTITGTFTGPLTGNASTATTLQTARNINGTSFNGSADITTANWGTPRTITIGATGKSVNGSGNVSWTTVEMGVVPQTGVTGAAGIPVGTTAQRPSAATGQFRFNTSINKFEGYNGTAWGSVSSGATGGGANEVFFENDTNVTVNYTITTGKNAMSAGPITIDNGVTVTVPNGSVWTVV